MFNIRQATKHDVDALLSLFEKAYQNLDHVPKSEYFDFEKCLNAAFDTNQIYKIQFFISENEDKKIIACAAIAKCSFMNGSWELRWGTTDPDFQKQGVMSELTQHRIQYAINNNNNMPGIVQIASRQPGLYKKIGFKPIFERNIDNYVMYLIKEI